VVRGFSVIADELNGLDSPNQASFYTSGKTTNEPAFLLQLLARQLGTITFRIAPTCVMNLRECPW
jgi:hypothetical protein